MSQLERNLTEGNVAKQLIKFCIPFLLSNFLQALYNITDTMVVSWWAGPQSISGVAIGGQITLLCVNFAIGFTVGGTVLVSQYFGAGKKEELTKTIGTMFTSLAGLSIIISVIFITLAKPILHLINTPPEAFSEAYKYLVICLCGTIFTFSFNAISGMLRGLGDSKNPLYFVLIGGIVNTLLDIPFVGIFHWGAAGDALSTIMGQAFALTLAVLYLKRSKFIFKFELGNFKIDIGRLKQMLTIGLPSSLQHVVTGMSFLTMTTLVNSFGVNASAAMGITGKFNGFAILPAIAMSSSIASMSGQNIGAGKHDRAEKTMKTGILLAFPIGILFFLLARFAPQAVMNIFTSDSEVVNSGINYIKYLSIDYLLVPFLFCINGLLIGAGMTSITMLNGMLTAVFLRVPFAYLFGIVLKMGLPGIGMAAPCATIGGLLIAFIFYRNGKWREKRLVGEPLVVDSFDDF